MIEYIKGALAQLSPTEAVVEACGVGYLMKISLNTYEPLNNAANDARLKAVAEPQVKLFVEEIIREDTHELYGFCTQGERELFRLLIGVSGVGAASARLILSAMTPDELSAVIAGGDERSLKSVKGIGAKTAQRIIVDLRDKINAGMVPLLSQSGAVRAMQSRSDAYDEALAALTMLGYTKAAAEKALDRIFMASSDETVESAIKKALAML